jgi:hypothetical protein
VEPAKKSRHAEKAGSGTSKIREPATPRSRLSGGELIEALSFTHLTELVTIDGPLTRTFYEIDYIRENVTGARRAPLN